MEIRLSVDDGFLKGIQETVGGQTKLTDLTRDALTILNWAVREAAAGRVVLSTNASGEDVHRLVMPVLAQVESKVNATKPKTKSKNKPQLERELAAGQ
jgi:hypothetical protein